MIELVVKVEGMMCGMCEAHVNDAVRKAFSVKKVTSSSKKGETVVVSEAPIDKEKLARVIGATGYTVLGIEERVCEKKGLFSFFHK